MNKRRLVVVETTEQIAKMIAEDFQSGKLQELLDIEIEDAGIIPASYVQELQELQNSSLEEPTLEIKFREVWEQLKKQTRGVKSKITGIQEGWQTLLFDSPQAYVSVPIKADMNTSSLQFLTQYSPSMSGDSTVKKIETCDEVIKLKEIAKEKKRKFNTIIGILDTNIGKTGDNILDWEIALSLGELKPDHPEAAFAYNKTVEIEDEIQSYELKLLVAHKSKKNGKDDLLFRISMRDSSQPLPEELELSVMNEAGEESLAEKSRVNSSLNLFIKEYQDKELTLKISLGDVFELLDFRV